MVEQGENGSVQPIALRKRTRTGCLKCRTRRRKCDEGKPQCHNCVSKGFECKYASGLTFLERNSYTVLSDSASTAQPPKYINLSFVNESPVREERATLDDHVSEISRVADQPMEIDGSCTASPPHIERNTDLETSIVGHREGPLSLGEKHVRAEGIPADNVIVQEDNETPFAAWSPEKFSHDTTNENMVFGDHYESALYGLLALGNGQSSSSRINLEIINQPAPTREHHERSGNPQMRPAITESPLDRQSLYHSSPSETASPYQIAISDERILDLIRHYRYQIAPWLDIYDLDQSFGMEIFQACMQTDATRFALLALSVVSANSLNMNALNHDESRHLLNLSRDHRKNLNPQERSLLAILDMQCCFVSNVANAWKGNTSPVSIYSDSFDIEQPDQLLLDWHSPLYGVVLRLELSSALIHSRSVKVQQLAFDSNCLPQDLSPRITLYAQRALFLCIRALNLSCGEDGTYQDSQKALVERPRMNLLDSWRTILEQLDVWYNSRPYEFHPTVELSAFHEATFPTIIYTNGAAIFANQLYHTAMLLLLLRKPRTLRLSGGPSYTSPLWHAERLCGIALTNERRECWDPCLLASLLIAARRMTHESQQQTLLDGFGRIQRLTGFDIGDQLNDLRGGWLSLGNV